MPSCCGLTCNADILDIKTMNLFSVSFLDLVFGGGSGTTSPSILIYDFEKLDSRNFVTVYKIKKYIIKKYIKNSTYFL